MFCRNCKGQINPGATFCTVCGVPVGAGKNFCPVCGGDVDPLAVVCVNCGVPLVQMNQQGIFGNKSKLTAGLLGIFLGGYGVHNFYLGYYKKAIIQLSLVIVMTTVLMICFGISSTAGLFGNMNISWIFLPIAFLVTIGVRIWTLIEGILILTGNINKDGKGKLLKS